jgi:hypothetical protein
VRGINRVVYDITSKPTARNARIASKNHLLTAAKAAMNIEKRKKP